MDKTIIYDENYKENKLFMEKKSYLIEILNQK